MPLPNPILLISKNDEVITMEALTDNTYEKCYFPSYEIGKPLENPRKTKVVSLQSNGRFKNVRDFFAYQLKYEGYITIPQNKD